MSENGIVVVYISWLVTESWNFTFENECYGHRVIRREVIGMPRLRLNKHILRSHQNRTSSEDDFPEVIEFRETPDADNCSEDK